MPAEGHPVAEFGLHGSPPWRAEAPADLFGSVCRWTRSFHGPYPGFRPKAGSAAEYNGNFMIGQIVLRGSNVATLPDHGRKSYRNFFPSPARWQFSGLRLARDL